ncbi:daunorubicin/doxorubicin resistance ABC transporter ATP-binding protein DrrA [Rhodococcus sp. 14-2483-1-2]|nr:daunorubicin/doxorubicin resistance ABC transporter ATP-binding protein DrrA [Rhodococcus sp. 14-2483-1-2]
MVYVENLTKSFGEVKALQGVDLTVHEGNILGLLGPNGAGKTTTINVLTTLVRPDGGVARVDGIDVTTDPGAVRSRIGLTGQFAALDDNLTARENLVLFGRLLKLGGRRARIRADELLEEFGLSDAADRHSGTFSGGMKRRLDLAASMVGSPRVLFLDEPTTGLDPRSRNALWEVVRTLKASGVTIVLTTQYLAEADELADDIVVIDHGRVIAAGTSSELKTRIGGSSVRVRVHGESDRARTVLSTRWPVTPADDDTLGIPAEGSDTLVDVVRLLDENNIAVAEIGFQEPSLDDVFLALTGSTRIEVPT